MDWINDYQMPELNRVNPNLTLPIAMAKPGMKSFPPQCFFLVRTGQWGIEAWVASKTYSLKGSIGPSQQLDSRQEDAAIWFQAHCFDLFQIFECLPKEIPPGSYDRTR